MASGLPRVFPLRFKNGQLAGRAALHDVRCVGGVTYRLAGDEDLVGALQRLPVAPQPADVEELLGSLPGAHALRAQGRRCDWVAGDEAARVALQGSAWVVCVGRERAPSWLAELVAGADPQIAQRLLAGAMIKAAAPAEIETAAPRPPRSSDCELRATPAQSGRAEKRPLEGPTLLLLGVGTFNTLLLLGLLWLNWASRPASPREAPEPSPSAPAVSPAPVAPPSASPSVTPAAKPKAPRRGRGPA